MNKYRELRDRHQAEFNEFPMFFAFSNKQFEEGMASLGLRPGQTNMIYSMGGGGYYRKADADAFHEMLDRHDRELKEAMMDEEFAYKAFSYELGNHEYCISYDVEPTLTSLGLSTEDIRKNPMWLKMLQKAMDDNLEWHRQND